jgi:hypothetical protein
MDHRQIPAASVAAMLFERAKSVQHLWHKASYWLQHPLTFKRGLSSTKKEAVGRSLICSWVALNDTLDYMRVDDSSSKRTFLCPRRWERRQEEGRTNFMRCKERSVSSRISSSVLSSQNDCAKRGECKTKTKESEDRLHLLCKITLEQNLSFLQFHFKWQNQDSFFQASRAKRVS